MDECKKFELYMVVMLRRHVNQINSLYLIINFFILLNLSLFIYLL